MRVALLVGLGREATTVVLAAYRDRPRRHRSLPETQVRRLGAVLGHKEAEIRGCLDRLAGLDAQNPGGVAGATRIERELFALYESEFMRLQADAEWIVRGRIRLPRHLADKD